MNRMRRLSAGYMVGWLLFATAALRALIFYTGKSPLPAATALLAGYALLYAAEPFLSPRLRWFRFLYFPVQTGLALAVTNLRPFLDVTCQLYIALGVQALHAFGRRAAKPRGHPPAPRQRFQNHRRAYLRQQLVVLENSNHQGHHRLGSRRRRRR